ncbi:hypothetical protein AWZ03_013116 [Drosophila navojoa]|uniref:Uncharacterized protein n=1 Tax=Drosophila navojoa TaxID=7232 RepID=A0A484AY24_DRONA|nr:hypothetical protein AWZ03_013116 [Drosophila navojoa]
MQKDNRAWPMNHGMLFIKYNRMGLPPLPDHDLQQRQQQQQQQQQSDSFVGLAAHTKPLAEPKSLGNRQGQH